MKIKLLTIVALSAILQIGNGIAATGIGTQTDIDMCASLFSSDAHCATWIASGNMCDCNTCSGAFPNSIGYNPALTRTKNNTTYALHTGCTCTNCNCGQNPDSRVRGGNCTCKNGYADYSTCTATPTSEKCTPSNCKQWSVTLDGVFYCATTTKCSVNGAYVAYYVSTQCADNAGVSQERCAVAQCQYGVASTDKSACVCSTGSWGTSPTTCEQCPDGGTSDLDFHPSKGPYIKEACYMPPVFTGSDKTGTWACEANAYYSTSKYESQIDAGTLEPELFPTIDILNP